MDELNLDEYLPSPFQEIDNIEKDENDRLDKEGRLKIAGDDQMMSYKQYQDVYGNYLDDCSIIVKKML